MKVQISLRAPNGQSRIQVDEESTLKELVELIKAKTELNNFTLKYGYPLRTLDTSAPSLGSTVKDLKLRGETIVVARLDSPPPATSIQAAPAQPQPKPFTPKGIEPDETSLEWPERGGYIGASSSVRRVSGPAANRTLQCSESCLTTTAACVSASLHWFVHHRRTKSNPSYRIRRRHRPGESVQGAPRPGGRVHPAAPGQVQRGHPRRAPAALHHPDEAHGHLGRRHRALHPLGHLQPRDQLDRCQGTPPVPLDPCPLLRSTNQIPSPSASTASAKASPTGSSSSTRACTTTG